MLGKLLKKEFVLAMHPITPFVLLMAAMVMIPNYPYTVVFFYMSLAIFFTCLLGRENKDIEYTLSLPVAQSDVVKSRMLFAVLLEIGQMVLVYGFSILKTSLYSLKNEAGMEANLALLGFGFLLYAVFNFVFFTSYYGNVNGVGGSFLKASILFFVLLAILEATTFVVPFVRDRLDTPDPTFMPEKIITVIVAACVYAVLTFFSYKKSVRLFETKDR